MKNSFRIFLYFILSISSPADELVSVDATGGLLTVQQRGALKSYRLKPFTDITINGQKGALTQLKPGMDVAITLSDPQTASKVVARGNLGYAATPTPGRVLATPIPFFANRSNAQLTRKLVIKASIDGDDKFIVQDGKIRIRHGGWQKPTEISVNGVPWKVQWSDNDSDDFTALQFAPFAGATVTVRKIKGRGDATVLEPPTDTNGQKLLIHFKDDGGGASSFEVRVDW